MWRYFLDRGSRLKEGKYSHSKKKHCSLFVYHYSFHFVSCNLSPKFSSTTSWVRGIFLYKRPLSSSACWQMTACNKLSLMTLQDACVMLFILQTSVWAWEPPPPFCYHHLYTHPVETSLFKLWVCPNSLQGLSLSHLSCRKEIKSIRLYCFLPHFPHTYPFTDF